MELAVTAPLVDSGAFGDGASILAALCIGTAFGWALERAGLGSARKLMGQFYLTDLTVFKVMFSAIATAMLGAFWLARLGLLDLSRVYVPETYLWPQLVGGLVFGLGFALAGLCPGTSCVAAATGRGDGVSVVGGMFFGVLVTGLSFDRVQAFYATGARGSFTLPQLLGLSDGTIVAAIVAIALAAFWAAERFLPRATDSASSGTERRMFAGAAIVLAVFAAAGGATASSAAGIHARADKVIEQVEALDLAEWIKDRRQDLQVVDLRSIPAFVDYHVPTAVRIPIESLRTTRFAANATVVMYGDDEQQAERGAGMVRALGHDRVLCLKRGVTGWLDEVMNPRLPAGAMPDAVAAFARTSSISRYFGGVPRVGAAPASTPPAPRRGC
jgi:uncharacterized membrane protein YedE/YeeE/rhodanese-related sulfurtransferase